jgi:metallo-beta-lactamase class B
MIPYKSRAGRAIRSFLGGTVGACAAFLMIVRAEAGEEAGKDAQPSQAAVDLVHACQGKEGRESWTAPAPPARIFGNTWYVGTCGISAILITSDDGHVLIDGGPAAAAPLVADNIKHLGFKLQDVKWMISSHEHDDHVGALAALKRFTGARLAAIYTAAASLSTGKVSAEDPQRAVSNDFAPVLVDRVLNDGGQLRVGQLRITVRSTPAHSPGSASWTWESCEKEDCRTMTYADSATTPAADAYRFNDHPDRIAGVREGLARIKALPCGILLTPHPDASNFLARMARTEPLADAAACRLYGERAEKRFAARLAEEGQTK